MPIKIIRNFGIICVLFTLLFFAASNEAIPKAASGSFGVVSVSPAPRTLDAAPDTTIAIIFDTVVNPATVTFDTIGAFGRWSGPVEGTIHFEDGDTKVVLTPDAPFSAGEIVMVNLSNAIMADDGSPFVSTGYTFQFWVQSAKNNLDFDEIDTMSTKAFPDEAVRSYGGIGTDLDNDGWLDITVVNEDSADLRVFQNKADGTGLYHDFTQPTIPVGDRASPSEPADFNNDGNADIAVANINTDTVSVLLGNGDGTFAPQQQIAVGDAPRGLAVLDVDGDGDIDIANTNSAGAGSISILRNNGSGVFGPAAFFEGGGTGEWGLVAADMDEDGILDLGVSARVNSTSSVIVHRGNGDGTFTQVSVQNAGGAPWMVNAGDVNGDGHEDIAVVNSSSNLGAILLGDGMGNLAPPQTVPTDNFPLATDLGDIDGDGDLDWVTSSFGGDWWLFLNDGAGNFTFFQDFRASAAASCALMMDINNDQILDLALIDEIADEVILVRNNPDDLAPPSLLIEPAVLMSTQPADSVMGATMTISNTGEASLDWSLHETSCEAPENISWLGVNPTIGSVPGGISEKIAITFNSIGISPGDYTENICLASNDPLTPQFNIPVVLIVEEDPVWWMNLPLMQRGE